MTADLFTRLAHRALAGVATVQPRVDPLLEPTEPTVEDHHDARAWPTERDPSRPASGTVAPPENAAAPSPSTESPAAVSTSTVVHETTLTAEPVPNVTIEHGAPVLDTTSTPAPRVERPSPTLSKPVTANQERTPRPVVEHVTIVTAAPEARRVSVEPAPLVEPVSQRTPPATIEITIDRIEVRNDRPAARRRDHVVERSNSAVPPPALPLAEYLARRGRPR